MLKDITIGQYYNIDSIIHKLDPRTKLMGTICFIVALFMKQEIISYLLITCFLVFIIKLSKVPLKYMLKGLKSIFFLLTFSMVFNLFLTAGTPIFTIWRLSITDNGVKLSAFMAVRLVYLILGSSLMTLTTTPNELTDGIEKGLRGLNKFGVPVHAMAMMMSIALRYIPILSEETDKIMKAQMARGADFESGNFIKRAKSMIPILVPLFISAFRRATDLAMAMESRCYDVSKNRTKMKPLVYTKSDYTAYVILLLFMSALICISIIF